MLDSLHSGAVAEGFRLSPQQRALWPAQVACQALRTCCLAAIEGPLDAARLRLAARAVARGHEILRTTFPLVAGVKEPVQAIAEDGEPLWSELDLCGAGAAEQRRLLDRLFDREAATPFVFDREPLARLTLVRLAPERHALLIVLPALLADGRTAPGMVASLARAYAGGREEALPPAVQYADYAEWQNQLLLDDDEEAAAGRSFWRRLRAAAPPLAPPLASPLDPAAAFAPAARSWQLPAPELRALEERSERLACGLEGFPLAAWQALLARLAGERDFLVACTLDGRPLEQLHETLGPCARAVPLRCRVAVEAGFEALARAAGQALAAARERQEYHQPEEAAPGAGLEVGFELDDAGCRVPAGPLSFAIERRLCVTEPIPLKLCVHRHGGCLELQLLYDRAALAAPAVAEIGEGLLCLVRAAVRDPAAAVGSLPLLGAVARHRVSVEWNDTSCRRGAGEELALQAFALQAAARPEAPAIAWRGQLLSYRELDGAANRLAARLRELGVARESLVALCLERSPDMAVAVLAVWRAGGAFVAIDPELPPARQDLLLALAQPAVLVASRGLVPPAYAGPLVVTGELPASAGSPAPATGDPGDLAYLAFTSGSTGRPKAVMGTQGGVANYLAYLRTAYGLAPGDRVLQLASLSFDAAIRDLIGPLTAGATVHLVGAETARDPAALAAALRGERIGRLLSVVPSLLRAVAAAAVPGGAADPGCLRLALVSGERLYGSDCHAAWRAFGDGLEIVNQYGPTECTMTSSFHRAGRAEESGESDTLPLGRPIRNARFHLLDQAGGPLPPGAQGEIYIGGDGLARGYFGQPGLTAERFVPDGVSGRRGERLYRTGDRGRLLPDGRLEFGGRLDAQVKVRGFRVELGEVEAALRRQPEVGDVAVAAREDEPGDVRLVAYVVAAAGGAPPPGELRRRLERELPDYMLPAAFVGLPALPRTPNGKVDRRALPAPAEHAAAGGAVAPRTEIEAIVANLCARLLGRERMGMEENFFDAGGHSLLAAQLLARLGQACGVQLPLQAIFEVATLAELAARLDAALRSGAAPPAPPITPAPRGGPLPLSFAQERLWFIDQLEPGSAAYNMPAAVRVAGPLDLATLRRCCDRIVARHEVLRTRFVAREGGPVQLVDRPSPAAFAVVDLERVPARRGEEESRRLAQAESERPFDLARGPLLRVRALRVLAADHRVLVTLHHIAGDDWSVGLLVQELGELYAALAAGREPRLAALPVQYGDFASWQRQWLRGETLSRHLDYWRRQLGGAGVALELPADRPRPAMQSYRGASRRCQLPEPLAAALHALGRREGATLFMTLLAAFAALLGRYSGQDDVSLGTPVAGRGRSEIDELIGCFINTLVLRVDLAGDPSFRELLAQVRRTALGAHAHQDLPFEKLVDDLRPERDLGRSPLFQAMLTLLNAPRPALRIPGLECADMPLADRRVKLDLELLLREWEGGLAGALQYNPDLFDAVTMERLLRHFAAWLDSVAAAPERRLSDHGPLPAAERQQLLREWNDTAAAGWGETCLPARLAAQARETPAAVAVSDAGRDVTYGELAAEVGRRAALLAEHGAGRGRVVALCADRGWELLATMLSALASGGAFLPLDPLQPPARLAQLLAASRAALVVADAAAAGGLEAALAQLPPAERPTVLQLAELRRRPAAAGAAAPPPCPEDLAYVIYTSGSTGVPKGAMVEHRGMVNHLWAKVHDLELGAGDTVAQTAALTFDISVWQSFAALLVGGRAWICPQAVVQEPRRLLREIEAAGVTVLEVVPSLLRAMVEQAEGATALAALRWLVPTGEALPADLCRAWFDRFPAVRVLNAYGPTECSDDVAHHEVAAREVAFAARVPIGRPVGNDRLYVLDRWLGPLPIGARGEVCVAGAGVGRGYLAAPDRTAAAFVPDPFAGVPGGRLYRTGDLAVLRPDGVIDFLGRLDDQVKVRGFRIEPREIEAALATHAGVRDCAVVARQDVPGDWRLVAYVVPRREAAPPRRELREHLARRLPDHMVPAAFVVLERLPLTAHGKLDRRALPAPPRGDDEPALGVPRTPLEELIAGFWAELLGRAHAGRDDDFFAHGGHSLLATQLLSRVRKFCGIELPLRALFEDPTPSGLAVRIERELAGGHLQPAPAFRRVSRDTPLVPSFAQQRFWFLYQMDPASPTYNVAQGLRLLGDLRPEVLRRCLNESARRHESLRTTFVAPEGSPRQRIAPWQPRELPLVDLSRLTAGARGAELLRLAGADAVHPFDLLRGPLLRATLIALQPREHVLLTCMHHIISDAWSNEILMREMAVLYGAFVRGEPSPLAEPPIQYADYAAWQRAWLDGAVLESQLGFWRRYLDGAPPVLALPTDRPRRANSRDARGAGHAFELPAGLAAALREMGSRHGVTPFMALLACFQALLYRYTAQEDLCVGTPVAGRNRFETEGLIGCLVNTLVLRSDLSSAPTPRSLLARVREAALQVHAHQDLPFEMLVEELAPERSLEHSPLFQVVFVLQNVPQQANRLGGVELSAQPLPPSYQSAKFDLVLSMSESGPADAGGAGSARGALIYSTALFDGATIRRMAEHFAALLAATVADPDQPFAVMPLLPAAARRQVSAAPAAAAGHGEAAEAAASPLHVLFAARAARSPAAPALIGEGVRLTYGELDERANRLAQALAARGIGAESLVGLCVDRSPAMVVAILGILKAGAAYVPMDPAYPPERLAWICADSDVALTLAEERWRERLPADARVLLLPSWDAATGDRRSRGPDEVSEAAAGRSAAAPEVPTAPANAAYVIYTSGSSGRPKGVVVTHANVARLFQATERLFGFGPGDVWSLFHSYAFDFSVWEIWGALLHGGTLVVVPQAVSRSPHAFSQLLRRERVTVLNQTPSAFGQLAPLLDDPAGLALRLVIFGGEALDLQSLGAWFARWGDGGPRLVNMFGITETTVHVTARPIVAADLGQAAGSLVGGPISDLRVEVLDAAGNPVPEGIAGELAVGGPGLARGYLRRPELTAVRFVPDALGGEAGARLYRSGDLVRRRADGDLQYLGRIDQQVKIRGFRIELGEIEAALRAHPGVAAAACVCRAEKTEDKRLVAYAVPDPARPPAAGELRAWLARRLPEYMVPAAYVLLAELPLTENGKLDRRALPEPRPEELDRGAVFRPPRTPIEETLAGLWADLLGVDRVGVADSFFDLGGHSLLATRMISRVRQSLGVELSLLDLFAEPTLAAVAERVAAGQDGAAAAGAITRQERGLAAPLAYSQERFWLLVQMAPTSPAYNVAKAMRLLGRLDARALAASCDEIARRHEAVRTTFRLVGERPVQVVSPPRRGLLPFADLGGLPPAAREDELRRLAGRHADEPFDLASGPLLRLLLVGLGAEDHALLLCGHHIVFDGWSVSLFAQELSVLYRAFAAAAPSPLAELPIQYADFALWQRGALAGEARAASLGYWRRRLAGAAPLLELPTDRPRPAVASHRTATRSTRLPEGLGRDLRALCGRAGVSLYMALLAAWDAVLAAYSGLEEVIVGSSIANRTRLETEGLIGCFLNVLVLRTDLSGDPTFRELLGRVREVTLGAFTHQDLPFHHLLEELRIDRDLAYAPLVQVFFELQAPPAVDLSGLAVAAIQAGLSAGNYDLALFVEDSGGQLTASLHHDSTLFLGATAGRLLQGFERLLLEAVRDPDLPLSRLSPFAAAADGGLANLFTGDLEAGSAAGGGA